MEYIKRHQDSIKQNILKAFTSDESIEKARHGVYANTSENRKLNRVGQEYGKKGEGKTSSDNKPKGGDEKDIEKYARETKTETLEKVANGKNEKLRIAAKKELERRETEHKSEAKKTEGSKNNVSPQVKRVIDSLTTVNSKYSDPQKVTVSSTPKGNWRVYYDGKETGITLGGNQISEDTIRDNQWEHHENNEDDVEGTKDKKEDGNIVDNVNNGKVINSLFKEWNSIKTPEQHKKWAKKVANTKFGTYKDKTILNVMSDFNPKFPNEIIKKDFINETREAYKNKNK